MTETIMDIFLPFLQSCDEYIRSAKKAMVVEKKDEFDLVTNIDFDIEQRIIGFIKEHYPEDKIIAEETSVHDLTNEATWIIDPIDGTINFSYGSKLYGIQICRVINNETVFTIMYLPEMGDVYYAEKGKGAYRNNIPLTPQKDLAMSLSLISFGDFSKSSMASRPYQMKLIDTLKDEALKIRIFGSSCVDFCAVASGQTHCHIMFSNRLWEFKAGLFLCEEAGLQCETIAIPGTSISAVCVAHNKDILSRVKHILIQE